MANDESNEEEKYLGTVGIRGEENTRSAKGDESQAKVINLDTTGKRPQTAIPKVTVKKVETKEKGNESEEHKLIKTTALKVIEVTKVKSESEKYITVDKDKGSANETAEIKEPQKNVTGTKVSTQREGTKSKRSQIQEEAFKEKQHKEKELKEASHERSNAVAGNQSSALSDEAKDASVPKGEVIDKAQVNEDSVGSKEVGGPMTSEEEDLMRNDEENTEEQKLTDRRSDAIPNDTMPEDKEHEKEQEIEGLKESPDVKKIVLEFAKARKQRSKSQATSTKAPKLTASIQLTETVDTHQSSEEVLLTKTQSPKEPNTQVTEQENDSNEKLSVEELELAHLAERAMSSGKDVNTTKKTEKPGYLSTLTENQTTAATESRKATGNIAVKMEKLSKEEVSVPKDGSDELSSEKTTAERRQTEGKCFMFQFISN